MASVDPLRPYLHRFRADGDAAAMEELVGRTRARLLRIARRIGAPQDAEDSVQAAYHALLGRPELPDAPTLPWLITTVIRIAYRRKAIAARQSAIAERLARPRTPPSPVQHAAEAERAARIRAAVERLPAKYRNPLVLYYLEGLDGAETARILDLSPSTLRTRLQRGRRLLRSSLGPATTYGILLLPWLLLDGGRAFAGVATAPIGGAMQAKTVVTAAGIALAAGSLGVFVGNTTADARDNAPRSRADRSAREQIAYLHGEIAARDHAIEALERHMGMERAAAPGSTPDRAAEGSDGKTEARVVPTSGRVMFERRAVRIDPARARAAAERLGVTDEELDIARRAFENLENLADPAEQRASAEALRELGDRRARAMIAVIRGIEIQGVSVGGLRGTLELAHVPGQEQLLIELLADGAIPLATKQDVLRGIEPFDSPIVRDYLLQRLAIETDRYFFTSLLMALGRLKETRVIPEVRRLFQRDGDWIPFYDYGVFTLGIVGGPEAESVLLEYLRSGTLPHVDRAVVALAKINPAAARGEAQTILARGDGSKLSKETLEALGLRPG